MRRLLIILAAVAAFSPARAYALTVRDVVELSRAGLGEETLLALIEVDPSVFPIDTATLKSLKAAGVSERVIVAMVRSARSAPAVSGALPDAEPAPQLPPPQVIVVDHHDAAPQIREVPVAVPVYIPIVRTRDGDRIRDRDDGDARGPNADRSRTHAKDREPVYWGWGGKLRPDAWQPR
jgi:hypothetical protein